MKKLFILFIAVAGFGVSSFAQATDNSATAAAQIITPIGISKTVDLNFGNVAVQAATGGTVIMAPAGTRSTGGAGGVTLPQFNVGTVAAASFTVSGTGNYTYTITLPANDNSFVVSDGNVAHDMVVNGWLSSLGATGAMGTLSPGGSQVVKVGATLNVAAAQAPGNYISGSGFAVTVNYN